jgi:SAM-dependent methyltransferase
VTVAAPLRCPCCGGPGQLHSSECRDRICHVPGVWSYYRCGQCHSLWQAPPPDAAAIAAFYPEDYPFTRHPARDALAPGGGWRQRLKRLCVAAFYGYAEPNASIGSRAAVRCLRSAGAALPFLERRTGASVRYVAARTSGRLLDVGCGNGGFLLTLQRLGWDVEGVEPDPAAARQAQAAGLRVQIATLEEARLPAAAFDAITLSHVIEHLADPAVAIERLARALKPGGVLVSMSPNPGGLLATRFRESWFELDCPRHLVIPSRTALQALAERAGLRVRTFTSMRLFRWAWPASHLIRETGHLSRPAASSWRQRAGAAIGAVVALLPGKGEEIVCIAVKPGTAELRRAA